MNRAISSSSGRMRPSVSIARGVPRRRLFAAVVNCLMELSGAGVSHAQNCSLAGLYHRRFLCRPKGRGRVSPSPSDKGWLAPSHQSERFERSPDEQTGRIDPDALWSWPRIYSAAIPLPPVGSLHPAVSIGIDRMGCSLDPLESLSTSIDRKVASRKGTYGRQMRE